MKMRLAATSALVGGAAILGTACEPMQVGLVVDRVAYLGVPGPGGAGSPLTLTGRAFCSEPEALDLFVTITQNPDRRFHEERTVYCEGDTPFAETFQGTSFGTEEEALLDAELCTNRGVEDIHEDCVSVHRVLLIHPK